MVRETRHLWVGNLPENIREDRIREHFKRYGRVQSVKLLPRCTGGTGGEEKETSLACTVAFMDIKSASKAHNAELKLDDRLLSTEYYEPAAVPSGSGDQDTTSFTASPGGAPRFPNGHSSTADDHWPSRTTTTSSDDFLRRGYHDSTSNRHDTPSSSTRHDTSSNRHDTSSNRLDTSSNRLDSSSGRRTSRDRTDRYRANGPYIETTGNGTRTGRGTGTSSTGTSSGSGAGSWSSYESTRYNSTGSSSQADTGYSTTPTDTNERRSSESSKKKTKSRSGSRSASPSGSTSSRSVSRSRSRSSSTSSTSSSTSSSTTPKSRRTANHQPTDDRSSDDHRGTTDDRDRAHPIAHAICVRNLPLRSSDTSLKDGLFHEYKKHGKVTWVKVVGQNSERHAIVCFKKAEDVEKALEVSYDKLFFGCKIEVAPYQGYDVEDNDLRPYEAEIDEYHPKATRTLFIGNLEKDVTASDLRKHFDQFGEIIEIDIKKQGAVTSYAFCQYTDITSVVKAIRKMDGEHLGNNRIKLGFGKSMPYNCVWIDGINENVNEKYLRLQFEQFGVINKVHLDREKGQALIFYEQVLSAQTAVQKMRGFMLKNTKIQVDFASRECQEAFFERLEKQGTVLDRGNIYDERRESSSRSFEASAVSRFSSRYDTPTRPRTSSYSSRSSVSTSQVSASMQSPGTPGSITPRGTNSRRRFADYYDSPLEYPDRHFRNYDEYSQGSAASHEDVYEHEYTFIHDSPTHIDTLDSRSLVETGIAYAPPDIRNLQKERVHLLEQLEECPSSGDELMSPKKRLKLDLLESGSDVIIEANRDHRKVMEVRRLSDANLKHHSRRPSIDSGKHSSSRDINRHDVGYLPHAVCKRRKTASSDSGSRIHHYDHSGSESVGGSRPGTPLCDEKPENFQPSEPRRVERREREGPLTLPLPRFAAQILNRGSVSVAGIKGQKDVISSPPPAVTSPRISNPRPPSPVPVPPPASPPPRPPSLSSNSSDSDITPPSPSLEERIRSLDEKYEKWSGSRALSAAGGDALALLDANLEKFRQRHKLLDLDLKEVQPSEIVKSVMAKRSVFDEDLKRLENVGEKYEPKEFSLYPRVSATLTTQTSVPATPLSAPPTLKLTPVNCQLPKTPTMLSPRSSGTSLPAAKGLQYPFPTHPPTSILMSPVLQTPPTPTTSAVPLLITSATSGSISSATITRGTSHGENRLKPCATVSSSDTRTSSKVTVNRSSVAPIKVCEKTNTNIPNAGEMGDKSNKTVRETKSSDKTSEKISSRRDSSNSSSPRADVKTRRNSDTSARRIEDGDISLKENEQNEERKKERFEKIKLENERLEKERLEKERIEKERSEKERQEKERLEKERLEKDRIERESELEKQRLEKERLEKEKLEKEKLEREQLERERQEKERLEKEQAERERIQKEKDERERKERERKEREERERREQQERERREQQERERREQERERREKDEKERREREEREKKEQDERERKEREEQEKKNRDEQERLEKEKLEREKQEKAERDRKREEEKIRHKEDNHEKRNDHKHREIHSETKHRDNHIYDSRTTKECNKEEKLGIHELSRRDSNDSRSNDKFKHHSERDMERRKDSIKENRDNNTHDKHRLSSITIESRHLSMELDKNKSIESYKQDPNKRKERNNSLPANIGSKRRVSSHETIDIPEESKKVKLGHEHKKLSERRDSRDSNRSDEKSKSSKHKNNTIKIYDKHSTKDGEEKRRDKDREERHKKHKLEKQKSKSKSCEKDSQENLPKSPLTDKDFLARLDLRATEEVEKQRKEKETKSKTKEMSLEEKDSKTVDDKFKKEKQEKPPHSDKQKTRLENEGFAKNNEEKKKRDKCRKANSSESDSDEPKKHSIFDIVDDEPAYISMYDKVKARSCKNMAKQEEEKRQEKIKAKFSQLKQSRAKREEKKRSTSWDEDSDSEKDHSEVKIKRCTKMLIDSSDDESQDRKSRKKKDIYSDSDSSAVLRPIKQENLDTSEDEVKNKHIVLKTFKSRISGDFSEDEYSKKKIQTQIKSEIFSDIETTEIPDFGEVEEKPVKVKEELGCLVKKERRNSKHQEVDSNSQLFGDLDIKIETFNNKHSLIENTSDEETHELSKRERREKKHKKKQKKQKHSLSSEDISKLEEMGQLENSEKTKHHDKKKDYSKREKKREKNREGREKSKKSKKNKSENKTEIKREGKMENIFGSLSDDSEHGAKDLELQETKSNSFLHEESQQPSLYNSESEREHEIKTKEKSEKERDREEHRRKKEKKRREKERRLQAAAAAAAAVVAVTVVEQISNENSMDFADMGKQLEENMLRDDSLDATEQLNKDVQNNFNNSDDAFKFIDMSENKKEERREGKEKKKKRKKSKDEKSKHHHHHHHDKNRIKPESKKEGQISPTENIKVEVEESKSHDPSLPSLTDDHSPISSQNLATEFSSSPRNIEVPIVTPVSGTANISKEKKRDKFIPGFGTVIDEKLHESAVKSISEFEIKKELPSKEEECQSDKNIDLPEEKPRVVISQEETEDAVAALLGESFGGSGCQFEESFDDEINTSTDQPNPLVEESNAQDDEEMRQAVQSLSAADLDLKPDTPQSEHDLQIDTDTEEQEDISLRFDQPPKTPELAEISQPQTSTYFHRTAEEKPITSSSSHALTPTPLSNSPPSLTPIKPQSVTEVRKVLDVEPKSLPLLPEQNTRTVISQSWSLEKKQEPTTVALESSFTNTEHKSVSTLSESHIPSKIINSASSLRQYSVPPVLKITDSTLYPPLQPITKSDPINLSTAVETGNKISNALHLQPPSSPSTSQLHNLPARSPVQNTKPPTSIHDTGMLSPKLQQNLIHNRLPITPVMASKPLQATTVILQQSKVAHSLEPPKLVSTSDHRPQERPRMVFQTSTIQPPQFTNFTTNQPRMLIQGNIRHLPPQGLLVPTRQLPPHSYNYLSGLPQPTYSLSPVIKENTPVISEKKQPDSPLKSGFNLGLTMSSVANQASQVTSTTVASPVTSQLPLPPLQPPLLIPKSEQSSKSLSPSLSSPNTLSSVNSPKSFVPTSLSPKPSNSPSPKPSIPPLTSPNQSVLSSTKPVDPSVSSISKLSSPVPVENLSSSTTEECVSQQASKTDLVPTENVSNPSNKDSTDHLHVPIQEPKTSIPSPVITMASKEEVKETVLISESEAEKEQPVKLEEVIEDVTVDKEVAEIQDVKQSVEKNPLKDSTDKEEGNCIPQIKLATEEISTEEKPETITEDSTFIKDIEKFDEEKMETESVISDVSKERSTSADILAKDDPLDTKEDSDYWSAKEVNIDSVIKTLCSADELSDHSSENGKDDWFDSNKLEEPAKVEIPEKDKSEEPPEKKGEEPVEKDEEPLEKDEPETQEDPEPEDEKEPICLRSSTRTKNLRGRGRGKTRGSIERGGIQTRRGKLAANSTPPTPPTPPKRGRGGRAKTERKSNKSESESITTDVYEFRDEPDESNKEQRPRLILTIKSPAISNNSCSQTTAIVKEVTKDGAKEIGKEQPKEPQMTAVKAVEIKEEFASPAVTNTRKSRRLQEKDISRNTVDDTIEDVVKNTVQTRSSSNQRRSTRQAAPKQQQQQIITQIESTRKPHRGRKTRRGSEATETSSSEETPKEDIKEPTPPPKEIVKCKDSEEDIPNTNEHNDKAVECLKTAVLKRVKVETSSPVQHEPTNLIDPVTGELIPMRECEEGKYIPLPGTKPSAPVSVETPTTKESSVVQLPEASELKPIEVITTQSSVIAQPQPISVVQSPKPQSFKTHILSSQAAQAAQISNINQQLPSSTTIQIKTPIQKTSIPSSQMVSVAIGPPSVTTPPTVVTKTVTPVVISKAVTPIVAAKIGTASVNKSITPINQHLNVNINLGMNVVSSSHLSPRPNVPLTVAVKPMPKQLVKPPVLSPVLAQKQQILQVSKQPQITKSHLVTPIVTSQTQIVNTQLAHMKHQPVLKQVIMGKGPTPIIKPTHLHQQQILTAAVPSPPLSKSQSPLNASRIIQVPAQGGLKGVMDPPKVDVTMPPVMLGQRPKLSPQGSQQRHVGQARMPVPGYEASLHGERSLLNRSRSPPPAHQNSPSPKGEAIAHFPGPLRPPPDLNPAHYMHPSHVMQYQQYLQQQRLHLSRSGALEKVGDGQEGEEAPVTSPPLELRRPGSVGLALAGRGAAVPHSLHSPHDRVTDSPQVGQVYNVHSARMQHYHPTRYYDQAEPPPAHRPLTSHGSLSALGSHLPDRPLSSHMTPIPDRPLSGHSLTSHMTAQTAHMGGPTTHIERPLSAHGLMGATLGAAGNLMGAVARHIGADTPTSQRGLQAATPPHASQVPPQAESLFMLLKQYPCMWQGLLALKNDQAAVQMYFVSGNDYVAKCSLPKNTDGSTPPLRIFQRMRLEPPQVEGVARKMQMENEHCMLLALPCGHDHMDVLKQSTNLTNGFITYLQHKQAAGIVNVAAPGTTQPPAYVVHIFPSCDFVNENLRRIAPSLLERVADIAHLLIVITTV